MAIILELQYGKKLGLPAYSSHNFSVSLKTEAASLDQIPQEVERAYHILQQAVDSQITNPGYVPGMEAPSAPSNIVHLKQPASTQPPPQTGNWRCSPKQKALALTGCRREQVVVVDTSPIGSGLAVIGIGMVLAAWITSFFGGGQ